MPRAVTVRSPLDTDTAKFIFRRLTGTEELGRLFEYQLELYSSDHNVKPNDLLGQALTVTADFLDGRKRYFHGYVCQFTQSDVVYEGYAGYKVFLRPLLWFFQRSSDCRIFQEKTVPDILQSVFSDHGLSDLKKQLSGTYRQWEYCVQYAETDFNFVSRLMEHEGIYYFFEHENGKHNLVLADSASAHSKIKGEKNSADVPLRPPLGGHDREYVWDWQVTQQVQPGTYGHTAFDFTQPKTDLETRGEVSRRHQKADGKLFHYPGTYTQAPDGQAYAKARIHECHAQYEVVRAQTDSAGCTVGGLFRLRDSPREAQNREYLITSVQYELAQEVHLATAKSDQSDWKPRILCAFSAISSSEPFRPPRLTPKSIMRGPQTAIVVGKQGEEIWTDKYGRVKVKFHWDRQSKSDENSSCWVRVAQVWAGKQWGAIHIPRIGQEVIVDFLEGDPDQPIITGRVYNADQMPPYTLPDNQTQSGIKSRSTKQGDAKTFNELRFEDKKGQEEIYFHAEKDFNRVVENNDTLKVGFEKKDQGDQTIEIRNNQKLVVGAKDADGQAPPDGSQTNEIWNNRTTTVKEGNEKLEVQKGNRDVIVAKGHDTHKVQEGKRTVEIKQDDTLTVSDGNQKITISKGNQTIQISAGKNTTEAKTAIELIVGQSSITLEPAKITIKSPQIAILGNTKVEVKAPNVAVAGDIGVDVKAPMTKVTGDGMLTLKGGIIKIN